MNLACVTGASSAVGRYLVKHLLSKGVSVRVLSRNKIEIPNTKGFVGCISSVPLLDDFVRGADTVFHCAAELHNTAKMYETNVLGTMALAESCCRAQVSNFCFVSSAGVVGHSLETYVTEGTTCNPRSFYEKTKYAGEHALQSLLQNCNLVVLRPTNIVSLYNHDGLAFAFSSSFKSHLKKFFQNREFLHLVHAEDVARAAIFLACNSKAKGGRFFVSLDEDDLNNVASVLNLVMSKPAWLGRNHKALGMPLWVPMLLRLVFRGILIKTNHIYSSSKLLSLGFTYLYSVEDIVKEISHYYHRKGGQ